MHFVDIIVRKRDGFELSDDEINFFIESVSSSAVEDYQISALLMAIVLNGMTERETVAMTEAMARSGVMLDLSELEGETADKHSTGGIGDKTTLVTCPIAASCGVYVMKMSGRSLGFTGGTIDKLETIQGFNTELSVAQMIEICKRTRICVSGQTVELTPADKRLYALRDVTATVDSIPLIAASVMSKKIAGGCGSIVLDVKYGSGAFMKSRDKANELGELMVRIGERVGRRTCAVLSPMDEPLGNAVGNSLEVAEAIEVLRGGGSVILREHCVNLAARMIALAYNYSDDEALRRAQRAIDSGEALERFRAMITAQGGDGRICDDVGILGKARYTEAVYAPHKGRLIRLDAMGIGRAAFVSGAGRESKKTVIDPHAGVTLAMETPCDILDEKTIIAYIHSNSPITDEAIGLVKAAAVYDDKS